MGTVKYSGPVASFHCPTNAEIRSLKVHFSPKQAGTGDPSPENVRPIVGWDGVEVRRSGKNLFNIHAEEKAPDNTLMSYTNKRIFQPNTYFIGTSYSNYVIQANASASIDGNNLTFSTTTGYAVGFAFALTPGQRYRISAKEVATEQNSVTIVEVANYKADGTFMGADTTNYFYNNRYFTVPQDAAISVLCFRQSKAWGTTTLTNIQLELGSTATSYEPYQGSTTAYEFGVLGKNKVPFLVDSKTISSQTNGNAGWCNVWKIPNKNLKYTYSAYIDNTNNTNTANITVWLKNIDNTSYVDGTAKSGTQVAAGEVGRSIITLDASTLSNTYYFVFGITSFIKSGETASCTFSNPMVEIGDTATTYEPYDPKHTVYGGWVDLITGEVASTYIHCKIKDLPGEWNYRSGNNRFQITLTDDYANATSSGGIWTHFATSEVYKTSTSNGYGNKQIATYIDKHIYIRDDDFEGDVEEFLSGVGDTYITYELAESTTYSLSPTSMQTFLGQNNVWSNADYVEVEYDLHETQTLLQRKAFIMANQPHIVKPAAAHLQNFVTDVPAPLKECKVHFEPVQEGEGDPSPDNIRAISGWTGATIQLSGKNLIRVDDVWGDVKCRPSGDVLIGSSYNTLAVPVPKGTIRVHQGHVNGGYINYVCLADKLPEVGDTIYEAASKSGYTNYTVNNSAGHPYLLIHGPTTSNPLPPAEWSETNENYVLLGDYETNSYIPTTGVTLPIDWTTEAGTVYGGYVDLVTGEVWKTWAISDLSTWVWTVATSNRIRSYSVTDMEIPPSTGSYGQFVGEQVYSTPQSLNLTNYPNGIAIMQAGYWYKYFDGVNYPAGKICYKLATPVLLATLTPAQLKTLRGTNNVWSNTGDQIDLAYWSH